MQAPAAVSAAADRPPDCYVVRPAGALADIMGAADLGEDELLLRLRELGLITYPSPLLGGLLELPEVLEAEVLARLGPTDVVLFGQAGRACRAAVVAFGVPQEEGELSDESDEEGGTGQGIEGGPLLLRGQDFVGSVERMAWAQARGCPLDENVLLPPPAVGRGESAVDIVRLAEAAGLFMLGQSDYHCAHYHCFNIWGRGRTCYS